MNEDTENKDFPLKAKFVKNWYSWGTPTGLGFWLIACGVFFVLLHYAGLMH